MGCESCKNNKGHIHGDIKYFIDFRIKITKADFIGWIGNIFFIYGAILLAQKNVWGFVFNLLGNLCYLLQGGIVKTPSLLVCSLALIGANVFGIWNWLK